jgi:hypothetical protein
LAMKSSKEGSKMFPRVGMVVHGYCQGYFGRDSYRCKRIEAIGHDWVVAREIGTDTVVLATFNDQDEMNELLVEWHTDTDRGCSCWW